VFFWIPKAVFWIITLFLKVEQEITGLFGQINTCLHV